MSREEEGEAEFIRRRCMAHHELAVVLERFLVGPNQLAQSEEPVETCSEEREKKEVVVRGGGGIMGVQADEVSAGERVLAFNGHGAQFLVTGERFDD